MTVVNYWLLGVHDHDDIISIGLWGLIKIGELFSMTLKVLLVDDSITARMLGGVAVKQAVPDSEIAQAANGDEAIEIAKSQAFDLFLIDVNMPGMNGLELCPHLQAISPDSIFIVVTANIQPAIQAEVAALGVGVIGKPINPDKLKDYLDSCRA